MTDDQIAAEMKRLGDEFDDMHSDPDFEGHGGSPGEWMIERIDELKTERRRRRSSARQKVKREIQRELEK